MNTLAITDLVNIVSEYNIIELGVIALASIVVIGAILAIIKVAMKPMVLLVLAGLLGWGLLAAGWFSS